MVKRLQNTGFCKHEEPNFQAQFLHFYLMTFLTQPKTNCDSYLSNETISLFMTGTCQKKLVGHYNSLIYTRIFFGVGMA